MAALTVVAPAEGHDNPWLQSRYERLLFKLGQHLEKQGHWPQAHAVYARCPYPGARGRAMRVLEKQGRFAQAYALFQAAQARFLFVGGEVPGEGCVAGEGLLSSSGLGSKGRPQERDENCS